MIWLGLGLASLPVAAWVLAYELQDDTDSWTRVERRDLVVSVDVEGELRAAETTQLGPPQIQSMWNFKISWLEKEGAEVREGQPLVRFDATQLQQELQRKMSERDEAEKRLEKAVIDFEVEERDLALQLAEAQGSARREELKLDVPEGVKAESELKIARIDRDLAQLEIDALESKLEFLERRREADLDAFRERRDRTAARVEELQANIAAMTITAPRSGTLIYVADRWSSEKIKVGDSVSRWRQIVEIPDLGTMRADGEVDEAHMGEIAPGQQVRFRLDAYPDREYQGIVKSIRRTVQTKSWRDPKKLVKLDVELNATDTERMRPGMRLRGQIEIEREETLVVPEEAVFPRPGGAVVYVKSFAGKREVTPEFGRRNQDYFGVVDGLREGDLVLRRDGSVESGS